MEEPAPAPEGYYPPDQTEPHPPRAPSSLPLIAGILLIMAGLSGFFTWSQLLALEPSQFQDLLPTNTPITLQTLQTCSIIGVIFSALTLIGGIMAFRRRSWGLAIVGSILGLFTIGIFFSASLFSLIGLALLFISRKEFT